MAEAAAPRRESLHTLPYDVLLSIIQYLTTRDICALHLTARTFGHVVKSPAARRALAADVLARCRPLPLQGFRRLADLSADELFANTARATQLERGWTRRTPRPARNAPLAPGTDGSVPWYTVVSAPAPEGVDWLSPITPNYTLCATRSGRVLCWDMLRDVRLAQWDPGARWALWKCRIEYAQQMVYLAMARATPANLDEGNMEFKLMRINFTTRAPDASPGAPPAFEEIRTFVSAGAVMNVFLLDPHRGLLAAFVWLRTSNTIALYVLPDWTHDEHIFVDTQLDVGLGIWSCILVHDDIIIHNEEGPLARQHVFPLSSLRAHISTSPSTRAPLLSGAHPPTRTLTRSFTYPRLPPSSYHAPFSTMIGVPSSDPADPHLLQIVPAPGPVPPAAGDAAPPDPFPAPWGPEGANFVRQWWPTLAGVPSVSCSAVLYALHDHLSTRTKYVLAQHYFCVPLAPSPAPSEDGNTDEGEDMLLRKWFVSAPFEVACRDEVLGGMDEGGSDADHMRPLLAVDFGLAVWLEFEGEPTEDERDRLRLRCVSFPSVRALGDGRVVASGVDRVRDPDGESEEEEGEEFWMEGRVRTLEIPDDLDLSRVESVNVDQSQGAVILSVDGGYIFVIYYE